MDDDTAAFPLRSVAIVTAIAIALASVFAISYTLALGRPRPHQVPTALVGSPGSRAAVALEQATQDGIAFRPVASRRAGRAALAAQDVYAALDARPGHARLLVASASGTSVARLLEAAAAKAGIPVADVHALPSTDPSGLAAFYVTLAATILGFVTMFQLRANAHGLTLRGWLACIAGLAVLGGGVLALVVDPFLHALAGPFASLWAALAAQIAVAALFNATMLTLLGRWAIIPTWALFVAVGNASSGGAVAPPLLPWFYRIVGRFLPTGATVETIRNAVYFEGAQKLEPMLVEATWLLALLAALLVAARLRGRTPSV